MPKIEDLSSKLETITEIYLGAIENFRFCYNMHYSESEDERNYLNINRHIIFIRHSLWRLTVIDICKLHSQRNSDKYDIRKFINSLKPEGHFRKLSISPSLIQSWEDSFKSHATLIDKLNKLRDKLYAHSDPDKGSYKSIDILFSEVKELLDLTKSFIDEISRHLNLPALLFDSPWFDSQKFEIVTTLTKSYMDKISHLKMRKP